MEPNGDQTLKDFQKEIMAKLENEYLEFLIKHMAAKGLQPQMISGLIRDVANILSDSRYVTCALVNEKLAYLGWDKYILDETSLQLITFILEQQGVLGGGQKHYIKKLDVGVNYHGPEFSHKDCQPK